jgi:Polyketide cyclase / dehydrase and lipid transport
VKQAHRLTEAPPASGSRYRVVGQLLGRPVESSYLVTGFDPGRGFEGTMSSPAFGFSERYRFEPAGAGTRVSMSATVEPHGLFRLLGPVMAAGVRRQVKADHRRLKTVLERPAPIADPASERH